MTAPELSGQSARRIDAPGKVTGQTLYPGDIAYPDMLHMATLFAGRPHARILSIDTAAAEAAPGVVAVFTAADVPVNEYGLQIKDQPVLCGPGSTKAGADVVRFVGDQVALVVAETEDQARAALQADPHRVGRPAAGARPGSGHATRRLPAASAQRRTTSPTPIASARATSRQASTTADVVIEGVYQTPVQEHAYLQPEAGRGLPGRGRPGHGRSRGPVDARRSEADRPRAGHPGRAGAGDLPGHRRRVRRPRGHVGADHPGAGGLAPGTARHPRPIKTIWSREESIVGHGKRHAMKLWTRWGAKRDGKLVAAEVKVIADGGAYCYTSNKVLGNTTLTCTGPYEIPNVAVDTCAVYTNNVPGAAFRGFGGPQGHFAAESQMDKLAEALGMDPVELRLKNILTGEKLLIVGTPIPGGVGLTETDHRGGAGGRLDAGRGRALAAADARRLPMRRDQSAIRSVRLASASPPASRTSASSFGYQENSYARVELRGGDEIAEAIVYFAGADVRPGQPHDHRADGRRGRSACRSTACGWSRPTRRRWAIRAAPRPRG